MKRVVRRGVFETNSSSVHSLTMCSDEEWKAWERGERLWYEDKLITIDEFKDDIRRWKHGDIDHMTEDEWKKLCDDCGAYTFESIDNYIERCYYEWFDQTYTTPKGEIIHAFGYYGHD